MTDAESEARRLVDKIHNMMQHSPSIPVQVNIIHECVHVLKQALKKAEEVRDADLKEAFDKGLLIGRNEERKRLAQAIRKESGK